MYQETILAQYFLETDEFMKRYRKVQDITEKEDKGEKRKQCVLFSYFDSKLGPRPFYCYPENSISRNDQYRISMELEFGSTEGFFIKSYAGFNVIHLYFELKSFSARGGVEMCLISLIFNELPSKELLEIISFRLFDFIEKLQSKSEIPLIFSELTNKRNEDLKEYKQLSDYIREWVIDVYHFCIENYFERSFEGEFAKILMSFNRVKLLEKLSEGPIEISKLEKWIFDNLGGKLDLMELLSPLFRSDFVIKREITGQDIIMLLKGLDVYRIPPIHTIERLKSFGSMYPDIYPELEKRYLGEINRFFQEYKNDIYERVLLAGIIFNPINYSIISQFRRRGIFLKADFETSLDEKIRLFAPDNLKFLKEKDIIIEIEADNEEFVLLKSDIKFEVNVPKYIILGERKEEELPESLDNLPMTPEQIKHVFKCWFS